MGARMVQLARDWNIYIYNNNKMLSQCHRDCELRGFKKEIGNTNAVVIVGCSGASRLVIYTYEKRHPD